MISDNNKATEVILAELNEKLTDISQIFSQEGYYKSGLIRNNLPFPDKELSDGFIKGIRAAAKTGIKLT